jgi:tetratricopeptide (TPR) repeat protein
MTFRSYISRGRRVVFALFVSLLVCPLVCPLVVREARADEAPNEAPAADAEAERARRFSGHIEQATRAYKNGEYDRAIEAYQAALEIQPNPLLLFNIAQSHRRAGRAKEALTFYERFLAEAPKSKLAPEVRDYLNALKTSAPSPASPEPPRPEPKAEKPNDNFLGTKAQRAAEFRKQITLASAHLEAGNYDLAASAFWAAHGLKPQPIIVFNVAQVYRKAQRWSEALALYERYLREDPRSNMTAKVEAYIAEIKAQLDAQKAKSEAEAQARIDDANALLGERLAEVSTLDRRIQITQEITQRRELEKKPKPLHKRPLLWILTGAAAVGVILGVGLGVGLALRLPDSDLGKRMLNF